MSPGENGGDIHVDLSHAESLPSEPIDGVYVLVVEHEKTGGESIYGQVLGNLMVNFVTESDERRQQLDALLLRQGTYEVAKRLGKRLEWRVYRHSPQ